MGEHHLPMWTTSTAHFIYLASWKLHNVLGLLRGMTADDYVDYCANQLTRFDHSYSEDRSYYDCIRVSILRKLTRWKIEMVGNDNLRSSYSSREPEDCSKKDA